MYLHGEVQAGDNFSENMPSAGIGPATSRTAVEDVNHSTNSAIHFIFILHVQETNHKLTDGNQCSYMQCFAYSIVKER